MDTRIGWLPAIAYALAFTYSPIQAADEPTAEAAWSSIQDVVKAEGLRMVVEGWADGKPQPMADPCGTAKVWPWYRLSVEGGPRTYTFFSFHNPYATSALKIALVERSGEEWLLARMGFERNSDRPHVYFPVSLNGKAGCILPVDEDLQIWQFKPDQNLYDWETGPASKHGGQLTVEQLVRGRPQPLDDETNEETNDDAHLYRAIIQHQGQTYSFYVSETCPIYGRHVKVTRDTFQGQDCFHLSSLMEDVPWEQFFPVRMAGRYGQLTHVKDQDDTYILKSLDAVMEETMQAYEALADEEENVLLEEELAEKGD